MTRFTKTAIIAAYGLLTFLLALSIAWILLARVDFLYGVWHDYAGIKEGIERYGPQNRYRSGFAATSREQRVKLFSAINSAVHNSGDGLDRITYETATSDGRQLLLREPEIVHLRDVANLIDKLFYVMVIAFIGWPLGTYFMCRSQMGIPSGKQQIGGLFALLAVVIVLLLIFGAENVFNQLHVWIFPAGHQWFFYYQDSLMSTLMLAPTLFAWIAVALGGVGIFIFIALHLFAKKLCHGVLLPLSRRRNK